MKGCFVLVLLMLTAVVVVGPQGTLGIRDFVGIRHQLLQGAAAAQVTVTTGEKKKGGEGEGDFGMNYGNAKRRVPNGSDPIHNRRAGKSGEPPAV